MSETVLTYLSGAILEKFVKFTSPTGKINFIFKLFIFMLIGGGLNHLRHVLTHGFPGNKSYFTNFLEAAFTTLPMCAFALLLIGHLNSLQRRLYLQASQDSLTGMPNRRWFMDNTPDVLNSGQILIIIDVDNFKAINDTYGHETGDRCLQQVGDHLEVCLGGANSCARIGGEEFAAFLPEMSVETMEGIAQKISSGISFETGNGELRQVTTSVGVALCHDGQARNQGLRLADQAVYQAKIEGRARYVIASGKE